MRKSRHFLVDFYVDDAGLLRIFVDGDSLVNIKLTSTTRAAVGTLLLERLLEPNEGPYRLPGWK